MNERMCPAAMAAEALHVLEPEGWHAQPERVLRHVRRCADSIEARTPDLPVEALDPLTSLLQVLDELETGFPAAAPDRAVARLELVRRLVALGQVLMRHAVRRRAASLPARGRRVSFEAHATCADCQRIGPPWLQ